MRPEYIKTYKLDQMCKKRQKVLNKETDIQIRNNFQRIQNIVKEIAFSAPTIKNIRT